MTSASKPAAFYADFGGLASLKGAAHNQDPKALREAARQFESLFTQMMLKSMRQASDSLPGGDSMMDNDQSKMYLEMFDNQLSLQLAKGRGLGLADMLVKQLTQRGLAGDQPHVDKGKKTDVQTLMPLPEAVGNKKQQPVAIDVVHKSESPVFPLPSARVRTAPNGVLPRVVPTDSKDLDNTVRGVIPATTQSSPNAATPLWSPNSVWQLPPPAITPATTTCATSVTAQPEQSQTQTQTAVQPVPKAIAQETPRPQPLAKNAADFVRQLWPHAQKAARELGVDARTLIAHAALETGWGKFVPCNPDGTCSFNLFGIKATNRWAGGSTAVNTLEYEDGVAVKKRASFRAYESAADSFRDYASFIKNSPRYAAAVGAGGDAAAFATALQEGGYATDPNYASKLTSVAARMEALTSQRITPQKIPPNLLKLATNQPLTTGRSVSSGNVAAGDET